MQSRYYGAIIEHKFFYCQEEKVAGEELGPCKTYVK